MYKYACAYCSLGFQSLHKPRKYCSLKCVSDARNDFTRNKKTKICNTCKIEKNREKFNIKSSKRGILHFECKQCQSVRTKSKPDEWKLKERIRSRKKTRIKAGLDPNFEGKYPTGSRILNPNAKWKDSHGYILVYRPNHPNRLKSGNMSQHVFFMSEYLGRPLTKNENVHHKNGIKDDNRIENLELWTRSQPSGQRVSDKIAWCIELLNEYGYEVTKR